jgi:hypothetical protein
VRGFTVGKERRDTKKGGGIQHANAAVGWQIRSSDMSALTAFCDKGIGKLPWWGDHSRRARGP